MISNGFAYNNYMLPVSFGSKTFLVAIGLNETIYNTAELFCQN